MRAILVMIGLFGCTEYDLKSEPEEPPTEAGECATPQPVDYVPAATEPCADEPTVGSFDPVVEWTWTDNPVNPGFQQIMAAPVVANLTDDNGDGRIDQDDVPDVVFTAFSGAGYTSAGALVAISGSDGSTLWSLTDVGGHQPYGASGVAVADLGLGEPSVLVSAVGGLLCVGASGSLQWFAAGPSVALGHPAVGDLDSDGVPEVIYGAQVFEFDGSLRWAGSAGVGGGAWLSFPADLDGDGLSELIAGNTIYEHDGSVRWTVGSDGFPAVGDFDLDGYPELVNVAGEQVTLSSVKDGALLWAFDLTDGGGGPPTVADFDGDGWPEIGVASREWYRVIDTDGSELWANPVQDFSSSRTGSSVFDFEGDGAAEVVYADEETLWVYDGATGAVEMAWSSHSSGTLYEYPLVVDVDNDGSTEIVVASNDYSPYKDSRGITVIGDLNDSWAPARPVWNQHAYSITNVNDDGTIPASATPSWQRWNSFRAGNSETASGLARPDLKLAAPELCTDTCDGDTIELWIPVENGGQAEADAVDLTLVALDNGQEVFVLREQVPALVGGSMTWLGPITLSRDDFGSDGLELRLDDDGALHECLERNNAWRFDRFPCD